MKRLSAGFLSILFSLNGCSSVGYGLRAGQPVASPAHPGSVTVYVSNDHSADVRVYLVRESTRIKIGTVGSNSARRFVITSAEAGTSGMLQLLAEALGSRAVAAPEALDIVPGDEVDFHIESNLKYSRLLTRVYRTP